MDDKPCLLFCDTFIHEVQQEIQLDLIGFPRAVSISEIRVIPQGCKVHPEIRDRLGETKPSSFKLELFIKNLGKPNATVFQKLGVLDYEEGKSIQLISNSRVATNVVLVRGPYHNLTISIYGNFANLQVDPASQVPPPPPVEMGRPMVHLDGQLQGQVPPGMPHVLQGNPVPPPHLQNMPPLFIPGQMEGPGGPIPHSALPPHMDPHGFPSPNAFGRQSPQDERERGDRERDHFGGRDNYNEFHHAGGMDYRRDDDRGDRRRMRDNRERFDNDRRGRKDYYDRRGDYNRGDQQEERERFPERRRRDTDIPPRESNNSESSNQPASGELFEPLSPESNDFFGEEGDNNTASSTSANASKSKSAAEPIGYEDIESDEELMLEDCDFDENQLQNDFEILDENWTPISMVFNPFQSKLSSLKNIKPVPQTEFESTVQHFKEIKEVKEPPQVKQLQDYVVSDSEAERDSKWVNMLEELPNIIPTAMAFMRSQPSQKIREKHFASIITEWAVFGLSMEKVRSLPLAVNIRFLKAGLKLTTLLANSCDEYQRMLVENGVQEKLMGLLQTEHMASSLKLLILRALDATSNSSFGMENFLGWNKQQHKEGEESVYEELVQYILKQAPVRVVASVKALLQKAHFYESLSNLQSISSRISKSSTKEIAVVEESSTPAASGGASTDDEGSNRQQLKTVISLDINHKDMSDILSAIENIHKVFENGNVLISQPGLRTFPTSAKLQDDLQNDCYPTVMQLLRSRRFMESILVLVSSPLFCEPPLYTAIRELLFMLMSTYKGLLFLALDPHTTNGLVRVLLSTGENEEDYVEMPTLEQYKMYSELADQCTPCHLGLLLVFHLQSLQHIDRLLTTVKPDMSIAEMDTPGHISILHTLYAMTFTYVGRFSLALLLSLGDNLKCLLPFLTGDGEFEVKMKKSVCNRYAAVLLNIVLHHSDNIEYIEKFATQLLTIPKKENDRVQDDIHNFVAPLEKITKLDAQAISPLVELLKTDLEEMKLGSLTLRTVLMSLRLLKHLVKNGNETSRDRQDCQKDLKQKILVMQMVSSNAMEVFIQIFQKCAQQLAAPWKQNEPFSNPQCTIFVNIAHLLLDLTQILLSNLSTTSFCFKDARLVQELLTLHKILCTKPPFGYLASILTDTQEKIISLLIIFMKGTKEAPESEEAVKNSTWYILFKELLVFASVKPENFTTGLILLSELLPIPLPVHSLQDLSENEVSKVMNHRMFSMANFSCLGTEIKTLLKNTIGSCCSALQYYVRRVLCQLVDLGASVSSMIVRCLCEMIDEAVNKSLKESEESSAASTEEDSGEDKKKRLLPPFINNTFSLLSYIVCQPGGKAAFLTLITTTPDHISEFSAFLPNIIAVQSKESDWFYLENCLLPLVQSICDHEVCLSNFNGIITMRHLSNQLPTSDFLAAILQSVFNLLDDASLPIPLLVRCLDTLESLTDHDYGMQFIRNYIITKGDVLNKILERLFKEASEEGDLSQVYNVLSTFLELLNLLNTGSGLESYNMKPPSDVDSPEDEKTSVVKSEDQMETEHNETSNSLKNEPLRRSIFITASMLKTIFKLDGSSASDSPLTKIEKLIEEKSREDEELVPLSEAIVTLRMIIIASSANKDEVVSKTDKNETVELLPPEALKKQFNSRLISLLVNIVEAERAAGQNDWFDAPAPEEIDPDSENDAIKMDLLAISEKYLPNFKFKEEIDKGFVNTTEMKRSKRLKAALYKPGEKIDDTKRLRFDVSALTTHPSMRGIGRGANRGMTRGFFSNQGFRGRGRGFGRGRGRGRGSDDNFRQRRQNTSRPPSMHVDDFVSMENKGDTIMSQSQFQGKTSTPNSDRYSSNDYGSGQHQGRWNNNHGNQNFRRSNDGGVQNTNRNSGGDNYNRQNFGGGGGRGNRFHNRSNSDWSNKQNYSHRGSRDGGAYNRQSNRGGGGGGGGSGGGGGYWLGPKQNNDRFPGGGNYRPNRGRHQRTFTR